MSFYKKVTVKSDADVLHEAALVAQAALDAVPDIKLQPRGVTLASLRDEDDQIKAAIEPADAIAHRILTTCMSSKDWCAASRAASWLDGTYWKHFGVAA